MRKNTFYILIGCSALILLGVFWYSIEINKPLLIESAFVIGVVLIYFARTRVTALIEDERSARITEKASMRTMQIFWGLFCAFSIGQVMWMLDEPSFSSPISSTINTFSPGYPPVSFRDG